MSRLQNRATMLLAVLIGWATISGVPTVATAQPHGNGGFTRVNLVSDIAGVARLTDTNLVNPWGITFTPTGKIWVSDNGTGVATVYNAQGVAQPSLVTIPPPGGSTNGTIATPTGNILNQTTDFVVSGNSTSGPAVFLFATEDGTVAGWSPTVDSSNAILKVDNSGSGAVYKGIAMAQNGGSNFLYVANFHDNAVEMYDANFTFVGSFTDSTLPAGFAPFGIRNIGGQLYVTFALQKVPDKHDDQAGPGNGFVDIFNPDGTRAKQLIANGALNSPWGLVVAPRGFGKFGGALLVGNFGDGTINAFDPSTGAAMGTLSFPEGDPIVINGLWGLTFAPATSPGPQHGMGGLGSHGFDHNAALLYFTAGIADESHGLFGFIRRALPTDFR
jgi:uncharacterized protein (TIGR03118 family)